MVMVSNRAVMTLATGVLPKSRFKNWLLRRLGHSVASSASIGHVVLWRIEKLTLAENARLSSMTVFKDLRLVTLSDRATIGAWNWISAASEFVATAPLHAQLAMDRDSAITSRHYIDCSGGVTVGAFATVAGQRSTILSHEINFALNEQQAGSVSIGEYAFVSTNCVLLKGSHLPARSVLAAGGVLGRRPSNSNVEEGLWGGVPAKWLRPLEGEYFSREVGYVRVRK
jgi:acetyltransferase-like isoleucine patch superfamily enzyme